MISMPNMIATILYLLTLVTCLFASRYAFASRLPRSHGLTFVGAACFFALLATIRLADGENFIREMLREFLRGHGAYAQRAEFQFAVLAIATVLATIAGIAAIRRLIRARGRRREVLCAITLLACLSFCFLLALRMVSLHATDRILYSGPIRLNWIADLGLTVTILVSSVMHRRISRQEQDCSHQPLDSARE